MHKLPVTAIVAVRNEAKNIAKCLAALAPAKSVIVVDSGSMDATESIARNLGAAVVQYHFRGTYPKKRQWAMDTQSIHTDWILLVDADEVIPEALWNEIESNLANDSNDAYLITKEFHFMGRRLRYGGFSHKAVMLFRRGAAQFENLFDEKESGLDMEVHERLIVRGSLGECRVPCIHEDFKGLDAYIARHNSYATWEAQLRYSFLAGGAYGSETIAPRLFGKAQERRRFLKLLAIRIPFEPMLWFVYHYVARLGFLEGRRGLIASQIRSNYIREVRAKIYELRLRQAGS